MIEIIFYYSKMYLIDIFHSCKNWFFSKTNRSDFIYREKPEPHGERKREILKAHPEIKKLFCYEPLTKYIVLFTNRLIILLAKLFQLIRL